MRRRRRQNLPAYSLADKETSMIAAKPSHSFYAGLLAFLATSIVLLFVAASPAIAAFGFKEVDTIFNEQDATPAIPGGGLAATQAGSHPWAVTASLHFNYSEPEPFKKALEGEVKDLIAQQVPGLVGVTSAIPRCNAVDFLTMVPLDIRPSCPDETAIGALSTGLKFSNFILNYPSAVYNLEPPPGVPVRIGFMVFSEPVELDLYVGHSQPYSVEGELTNVSQALKVFNSSLELWGDPSDPSHDAFRGSCMSHVSASFGSFKYASEGICPVKRLPKPFLTLPTSCAGPQTTNYMADSWQEPGKWVSASSISHDNAVPPNPIGFSGCGKLNYAPAVSSKATTENAESGTGIEFSLDFDDPGLTNPTGLAQSTTKKAVVTLPEGMTVNPSIGEGLGVCSPADLSRETIDSVPGEGCPSTSKIGEVVVDTPLVDERIGGSVFLAQQDDPATVVPGAENPFDSLIAFYIVLKHPVLGALIKLPAQVEPDPGTGRLVVTLDDTPQLPFSHFNLRFREGQRAALVTPSACGTYTTESKLYPWSDPTNPRIVLSDFEITRGVGGGPCPPAGILPFKPQFEGGAVNNNAGSFSPFNMRLLRNDGEQNMTKFSSVLPPGQIGSLAGVAKCPDAAVETAKAKTGRQELASPSCPASSQIGRTLAGAGVGRALTYVGGRIYLGGPYKGAPLSVISITPAIAGPFDAGTVAIRLGLDLNPKTAEVEVDGSASDPIPHILQGLVLKLRDLRVYVDRPNFTLNPTSCDESSVKARLFGSFLDVLNAADDVPVDLATRYQAANCANLGFKPRLDLNLKGGTKRGGHPGLKALYTPRKGDANVEDVVVRLPRSAFLDQGHIRTICTRVQFAADACPKAAQYGYIRAWTPLLDEPLQGPVWLRSSNHKLPDLVFDLRGLVDVEVATRIDSVKGGIRAQVLGAPDAPLSKVVLTMQGGKKGLIINSRNLCTRKSRANVQTTGHNGKLSRSNPEMRARCEKQRK